MVSIIGIDPGKTGALALLRPGHNVDVVDMPAEPRSQFDAIYDWQNAYGHHEGGVIAYCEQQWSRPGESGVVILTHFGQLLGFLIALNIPTRIVSPQRWKKHLGLIKPKEKAREGATDAEKRAFKAKAVAVAKTSSRLLATLKFPERTGLFDRVGDHGRAEAALIAAYGMELENAAT